MRGDILPLFFYHFAHGFPPDRMRMCTGTLQPKDLQGLGISREYYILPLAKPRVRVYHIGTIKIRSYI